MTPTNLPALREAVAKYEAWKQNDDAGFNELIDLCDALPTLLDELETLRDNDVRGMCIIEAAIRSPSIAHYMSHWEGRCLKAEADLDRLATDYTDLGELLFGEAEYEHGDVRPRVVSILDDLAAARAVLDSAQWPSSEANGRLLLNVDAAAWHAWWQARKGLTP